MFPIDLGSNLLNYIVRRGFDSGDRLPTISELQHQDHLGMSASKVREELEVARALGLVEVRSRTGTRLKDYSFTPAVSLSLQYALARDPGCFRQFAELRVHIECAFWHETCALLEDEDKAQMVACVEQARSKLNSEWIRIPHEEHRVFHLTVFKRLDNPFVLGLLEAYWEAYNAVELNTYADYAYLQSVWDYHQRIIDFIQTDDFDAALDAFIAHTRLIGHQPRMKDMEDQQLEH